MTFLFDHFLSVITFLPLVGALLLLFVPGNDAGSKEMARWIALGVSSVTTASSQGWVPPDQGKRALNSRSTNCAWPIPSTPGIGGKRSGQGMNQPNAFAARFAELSGLSSLPLSSSCPPAAAKRPRT